MRQLSAALPHSLLSFFYLFLLSFNFSSLVLSFLSSFSNVFCLFLLRSVLVPLWISAFFFHILSFLRHIEEGTVCRRCFVGSLGFWNRYPGIIRFLLTVWKGDWWEHPQHLASVRTRRTAALITLMLLQEKESGEIYKEKNIEEIKDIRETGCTPITITSAKNHGFIHNSLYGYMCQ